MPLSDAARRRAAFLAVVAAASLSLDCKSPSKPVPLASAADAGAEVAHEATSYLFGGEDVARFVHWNRAGDLLGVSARSVWRLPGGALAPGARLVSEPAPESLHLLSVLDTQTAADRWLIGGNGFVAQRDPATLAEIRRVPIEGDVTHIELAAEAPVAAIVACGTGCRTYRLELDTGAIVELSQSFGENVAVSPSGKHIALVTSSSDVVVFAGKETQPIVTLAIDGYSSTFAFLPNETLLAGAGTKVGRWTPGDPKPTLSALPGTDDAWRFTVDPRAGRVLASIPYNAKLAIYDGTRTVMVPLGDYPCGDATVALDDPNAIDCPSSGQRIDAAGVRKDTPVGQVMALSAKHLLRGAGEGCEVAETGPQGKILGWNIDLCAATFSPDDTRLAWIDATGAVRVQPLAEVDEKSHPAGNHGLPIGAFESGVYSARFDRTTVSYAPTATAASDAGPALPSFLRTEQNEPNMYRGAPGLSSEGSFGWQNNRLIGIDRTGKTRFMASDARTGTRGGMATHVWHSFGSAAVSNGYGEPERKALLCRFDAACTELELAPAQEVDGYEAPWVLTTTTTDPDAPNQSVYYLRHDDAREPLRRVIAGHACSPALLLDHGNQLACLSDGKVLRFDTRSGDALGEPLPLSLASPGGPVSQSGITRRGIRVKNQAAPSVAGHTESSIVLRVSSWASDSVHLQERALPSLVVDAGVPSAEPASVAVLTSSFAVVRRADGRVRLGGDASLAERLLACRRGEELLPWSTCRDRALAP